MGSPWENTGKQGRERKRDVILRAAAAAFTERGFHNTSLDDVARRLEVSKPTVYYYVKSKEAMIVACCERGLELLDEALDAVSSPEGSGRDRVIAFFRHYADIATSDFGICLARVQQAELSHEHASALREAKRGIDERVREAIEDGISEGSIAPCDPKFTTYALFGAFNQLGEWVELGKGKKPVAEIADSYIHLFIKGLEPRST